MAASSLAMGMTGCFPEPGGGFARTVAPDFSLEPGEEIRLAIQAKLTGPNVPASPNPDGFVAIEFLAAGTGLAPDETDRFGGTVADATIHLLFAFDDRLEHEADASVSFFAQDFGEENVRGQYSASTFHEWEWFEDCQPGVECVELVPITLTYTPGIAQNLPDLGVTFSASVSSAWAPPDGATSSTASMSIDFVSAP